jgi:hypothetical protein
MRKGLSLRAVARELGYSAASLLEHRNAGAFTALSDGSYDLQTVVDGLLFPRRQAKNIVFGLTRSRAQSKQKPQNPERGKIGLISLRQSPMLCCRLNKRPAFKRQ